MVFTATEALRGQVHELETRLASLEAAAEQMAAALEPFDLVCKVRIFHRDDEPAGRTGLSVKHFRDARAALAAYREIKEE